ncbi:hypothetical protein ACSAZL_11060 [Methanosarcina sp. T3]|uniref:hypothetical protein n=1 Tax=Methanosarcina sp. T3 TaxID=3439062 RepID=UPI003F872CD2
MSASLHFAGKPDDCSFISYQWSGKHHQIVNGIDLETVVRTSNDAIISVDFRTYDIDTDGKTKNDHFLDTLNRAEERGLNPNSSCLILVFQHKVSQSNQEKRMALINKVEEKPVS